MQHERIIKSETVKTNDMIATIILTKHKKNKEWFRYIKSTDSAWNVEMGFHSLKDASARYDRDLAALKAL